MNFFIFYCITGLKLSTFYTNPNEEKIFYNMMFNTSIQLMLIKIDKNINNCNLTARSMSLDEFQNLNQILSQNIISNQRKLTEMTDLDFKDIFKVLKYGITNEKDFNIVKSKTLLYYNDSSKSTTSYSVYADIMEHIASSSQKDIFLQIQCLIYHTNINYKLYMSKENIHHIYFEIIDEELNASKYISRISEAHEDDRSIQKQRFSIRKFYNSLNNSKTNYSVELNHFQFAFYRMFQILCIVDLDKVDIRDILNRLKFEKDECFTKIESELHKNICEKQKQNLTIGLRKDIEVFYLKMCDPCKFELFYSIFFARKTLNTEFKNIIKGFMKVFYYDSTLVGINAIVGANYIKSKKNLNIKIDNKNYELYFDDKFSVNKKSHLCTYSINLKEVSFPVLKIAEILNIQLYYSEKFQAVASKQEKKPSKDTDFYLISPILVIF